MPNAMMDLAPTRSLPELLAERLVDAIISGRYPADSLLPNEANLAAEANVSRATVREAIKELRSGNIVRVEHGTGSFVNDPARWTALEPLVRLHAHQPSSVPAPLGLIECRRIIELGVSELAAVGRTEVDLETLETTLAQMVDAIAADDVDDFSRADLAFHEALITATGNAYIRVLMTPLERVLLAARRQTSAYKVVRENALEQHRRILDAVRAGDPLAAREAMARHMDQTERDLRRYVLGESV